MPESAVIPVARRHVAGESNRDGGHVHVHESLRRALEQRIEDLVYRGVVGEYREDGVATESLARGRDWSCAQSRQRIDGGAGAIPHSHLVARLEEIGGDARSHRPEANEPDVHNTVLRRGACYPCQYRAERNMSDLPAS